jgi:catechol 2,3-dioxygenase-like lactoylglutathione lyase family enzyme
MISDLHHITIIASSKKSIAFYEKLGFTVLSIKDRGYDQIVYERLW